MTNELECLDILSSLGVPDRVDEVTADWVERALKQNAVIPDKVTIKCLHIQQISNADENITVDGGGVSGAALVRLVLTYDGNSTDGLPTSMVCKFTKGTQKHYSFKVRAMYNMMFGDDADWAKREVDYFRKIAPSMLGADFHVPKAYFAGLVDDSRRSVATRYLTNKPHNTRSIVLMEDLHDWDSHTLGKKMDKEKTIRCMQNIAVLHAKHWNKTSELESAGILLSNFETSWRPGRYSKILSFLQRRKVASPEIVRKKIDQFLNSAWPDHPTTKLHVESVLPDWLTVTPHDDGKVAPMQDPLVREMLYVVAKRLPNYYQYVIKGLDAVGPQTLIHGDFHEGNHMFGINENEGKVLVLDFQFTGLGIAVIDVLYFLNMSVAAKNYQEIEDILKAYHNALLEHGVTDYSWDTFYREFEALLISKILSGPIFMGYTPEKFIDLIKNLFGAEKGDFAEQFINSGVFCRTFLYMTCLYMAHKDTFMKV